MPRLFSRAAIALLLAPCPAGAETGDLRWWGDARLRGEALDGQFRPGLPAGAEGLFLRTILGAEYDAGPLRIGGEIWDSRAYFTRTRSSVSTSEVNALEPVQLYVATDFSKRARLLLGRFTLDLG